MIVLNHRDGYEKIKSSEDPLKKYTYEALGPYSLFSIARLGHRIVQLMNLPFRQCIQFMNLVPIRFIRSRFPTGFI